MTPLPYPAVFERMDKALTAKARKLLREHGADAEMYAWNKMESAKRGDVANHWGAVCFRIGQLLEQESGKPLTGKSRPGNLKS